MDLVVAELNLDRPLLDPNEIKLFLSLGLDRRVCNEHTWLALNLWGNDDTDETVTVQVRSLKKLGAGNFGAVFSCEARFGDEDAKPVAMKLFRKNNWSWRTEAAAARRLSSAGLDQEGVVPMHAMGVVGEMGVLIFELMRGGTMQSRMDQLREETQSGMDVREALQALRVLVSTLQKILTSGMMIHQDIKPENLLYKNVGDINPCIGDFGLAAWNGGDWSAGDRPGGTLPFLPPDYPLLLKVGAGDIYALGVTIYYLLVNALPWNTREPIRPQQHLGISDVNLDRLGSVPPSLRELVTEMTHPEVEFRADYSWVHLKLDEVLADLELEALNSDNGVQGTTQAAARSTPASDMRRTPLALPAASVPLSSRSTTSRTTSDQLNSDLFCDLNEVEIIGVQGAAVTRALAQLQPPPQLIEYDAIVALAIGSPLQPSSSLLPAHNSETGSAVIDRAEPLPARIIWSSPTQVISLEKNFDLGDLGALWLAAVSDSRSMNKEASSTTTLVPTIPPRTSSLGRSSTMSSAFTFVEHPADILQPTLSKWKQVLTRVAPKRLNKNNDANNKGNDTERKSPGRRVAKLLNPFARRR